MNGLDSSFRLVILQFSFSNPDALPKSVKRVARENLVASNKRKGSTGFVVIPPTEKCSILEFLGELESAGYELVDAFSQERINRNDPSGRRTYHMARFQFAQREFTHVSEEFKMECDIIRADLLEMCQTALWRVRGFSNPFYKDGEEVPDVRTLSINLEVRTPLFHPDGKPVMVWPKDEKGERIGNTPIPLKAEDQLHL